jgi:hypothetical protein
MTLTSLRLAGLCLLLGAAAAPVSAAAQGAPIIPQEVRPASCPEGVTLLAGNPTPPRGIIFAAYDSLSDTTFVDAGRHGIQLNIHDGVNLFKTSARFGGRAPGSPAYYVFSMMVQSAEPRGIADRQLRFELPDSSVVDLGTMQAAPSSLPGAKGTLENMIITLKPAQARRLAAAPSVQGHLGTTGFVLSKDELGGIRGVLMYVACGATP